jgi:hypothetical protein
MMLQVVRAAGRLALAVCALAAAAPVHGGEVEVSPFGGLQYGGHLQSTADDTRFSLNESAVFGATMDIFLDDRWRVELLYSRQSTELQSSAVRRVSFPQVVERYMIGIQEELPSDSAWSFFGVGMAGATRLVPGVAGTDSDLRFAVGLSLGTKVIAARRIGFRFEARGFYTVVDAGGAVYCSGGLCLFKFAGSGLWQGDLTAAVVLRLGGR